VTILSKNGDARRKPKSASTTETPSESPAKKGKRRPHSEEVGEALRSAYEQAVSEDIPSEMLDLLGKLG
jgi:hypothetical protein